MTSTPRRVEFHCGCVSGFCLLTENLEVWGDSAMNKKITITSCDDCPHVDHKGAFGKVAYIPICRLAEHERGGNTYSWKELPWVPYERLPGIIEAADTGKIPEWCPLNDD